MNELLEIFELWWDYGDDELETQEDLDETPINIPYKYSNITVINQGTQVVFPIKEYCFNAITNEISKSIPSFTPRYLRFYTDKLVLE